MDNSDSSDESDEDIEPASELFSAKDIFIR